MINIKVILNKLPMPKPEKKPKFKRAKKPAKDMVKCAKKLVQDVENPEIGEQAWQKLKKLYEDIHAGKCKLSKKEKEKILKLITPTISKYAMMDNNGIELDTKYLSKG